MILDETAKPNVPVLSSAPPSLRTKLGKIALILTLLAFLLHPAEASRDKSGEGGIRVRIAEGGRGADGLVERTLRIENLGDRVYGDLLLRIRSQPMSYFGFSPEDLSVYPLGSALLYVYDPEGGLLLPRQEVEIKVYARGGGPWNVEVIGDGSPMAVAFLEEAGLDDIFGDYSPQSKEALLTALGETGSRKGVVNRIQGQYLPHGLRGLHGQEIVSEILDDIGVALGETLSYKNRVVVADRRSEGRQYHSEAMGAMRDGDLRRAQDLLRMSLLADPSSIEALGDLGRVIFLEGGDPHMAKVYVDAALQGDPGNPDALATLSEILWEMGDRAGAEETAKKAMGLVRTTDPEDD
jgi:hypothetical protein